MTSSGRCHQCTRIAFNFHYTRERSNDFDSHEGFWHCEEHGPGHGYKTGDKFTHGDPTVLSEYHVVESYESGITLKNTNATPSKIKIEPGFTDRTRYPWEKETTESRTGWQEYQRPMNRAERREAKRKKK